MEGISVRRVATFLDVAETLSVTETAKRFRVRQPAITQQIKSLEQSLGLKLFYRSGRELALTNSGQKILPIARRLILQHGRAIQDMQEVVRTFSRELRIGMSAPQTALPVARKFQEQYDHVQLSYAVANTSTLVRMVEDMELDAAFVGMAKPIERLYCQLLLDQSLVVILRKDHAWAGRRNIRLKELSEAKLVLREPGSFTLQVLQEAFEAADLVPENEFQIGTREAVQYAVAAGLGITAGLSEELIELPELTSVPLENGRLVGPEFVICRPELANLPPVSLLLETCAERNVGM